MNKFWNVFLLVLLLNSESFAQQGITFQAFIRDPQNNPVHASGLKVIAQILDPVNKCILREEEHHGKAIYNGYLHLVLGEAGIPTSIENNLNPVLSLTDVMNNSKTRSGLKCFDSLGNPLSDKNYIPSALDHRILRIAIKIGNENVVADFNMRGVAYALNSTLLNSKSDSDFINIDTGKGVTQANLEVIFQKFTRLNSLLSAITSTGTLPVSGIEGLAAVATSGSYNDLTDKPTIPAVVKSDWTVSSGNAAEILNKPVLGILSSKNSISEDLLDDGAVTNAKILGVAATKISGAISVSQLPMADGSIAGKEDGILNGVKQYIKGLKVFLDDLDVLGKLSAGSLQLSSANLVCNNGQIGTLRFDSVQKKIQYCDGVDWLNMAIENTSGGGGGSGLDPDDACAVPSPVAGTLCKQGTYYVGKLGSSHYMTTPGNCTNSATPTCNNNIDSLNKIYGSDGVLVGSINRVDGMANTDLLKAKGDTYAAKYCDSLIYGGYSDWFLPALDELKLFKGNTSALSVSAGSYYWTSTEYDASLAYAFKFSPEHEREGFKSTTYLVRCVRKY